MILVIVGETSLQLIKQAGITALHLRVRRFLWWNLGADCGIINRTISAICELEARRVLCSEITSNWT